MNTARQEAFHLEVSLFLHWGIRLHCEWWRHGLSAVYCSFSINKDLWLFCVPSCQLWKPQSWSTYKKGVQERCLNQKGQPGSKCRGQGTWGKGGGLNGRQSEASPPCCGFSSTPCPPCGPGTMGMKDLMNSLSDSKGGSSGLQIYWIPGWLGLPGGILWVQGKLLASGTQPSKRGFFTGKLVIAH